MKIYKNDKEKILKSSYTLTKETLVGTERGALQKPKKKRENSAYWAVILVTDTVVFQEPVPCEQGGVGMELRSWDTVVKSYFNNGELWLLAKAIFLESPSMSEVDGRISPNKVLIRVVLSFRRLVIEINIEDIMYMYVVVAHQNNMAVQTSPSNHWFLLFYLHDYTDFNTGSAHRCVVKPPHGHFTTPHTKIPHKECTKYEGNA